MPSHRVTVFVCLAVLSTCLESAFAQTVGTEMIAAAGVESQPSPAPAQATAPPPLAVEYSDAYRMRTKIHKISSFATIPLFATEAVLGQSLYSNPTSGKKDAHLVV